MSYPSDNIEKLRKLTAKLEIEDSSTMNEVCNKLLKIQTLLEKPKINKKIIKDELSSVITTLTLYGIS